MMNDADIAQLNAPYQCPPDAGPAWREAFDAGIDMSLIEDTLRLSPMERLRDHQKSLDLVLAIEAARQTHGPKL
jgi:hypothetical protein